jgi:hypothetical protein
MGTTLNSDTPAAASISRAAAVFGSSFIILAFVTPGRGHAQAAQAAAASANPPAASASSDVNAEVAALRAKTAAQQAQLDQEKEHIDELRGEVEAQNAILRRAGLLGPGAAPAQLAGNSAGPPLPPPPSSEPTSPGDRPHSERAADQLLIEAGGVLLPPWTLQIEPSLDETHVSNPRVNIFGYTVFNAINIGTLRVDDVSQDVADANLTLRMGLPLRTELDLRVPFTGSFVRQTKGIGTGNITEVDTTGAHLGDIQATLSWQPIVQADWRPAVVLRTRLTVPTGESVFQIPETYPPIANGAETQLVRAPTGSGYYAIEPGFTLLWRSDPLVFFAGASYSYHLPTPDYVVPLFNPNATGTQPTVTQVDHGILHIGDVIAFNAGVNFAVNERASLNFSFIDQYEGYTQQRPVNGKYTTVLGTTINDARLGIGASFGLSDHVTLVFNAGMGLTDQAPGYTLFLSLPITLPL